MDDSLKHARFACIFALAALINTQVANGQQVPAGWRPGPGIAGLNGDPYAIVRWDPDGPGPRPAVIAIGGAFTAAGNCAGNRVAAWDPVSGNWTALGGGLDATVNAVVGLPNGDLVAGGQFTHAGGIAANYIARWDGVQWNAMGSGMDAEVNSLTALPNGDVVAGGRFVNAGGISASHIARWNGSTWSPLGLGLNTHVGYDTWVRALVTMPNGDVIAGGTIHIAGGVDQANNLVRWNGTTWSSVGFGTDNDVSCMTLLSSGDLVVGGSFIRAGSVNGTRFVARWNGSQWSGMLDGPSSRVTGITGLPNGDIVVVGDFSSAAGVQARRIARWDGQSWHAISPATPQGGMTQLFTLDNGDILTGGSVNAFDDTPVMRIARWNGSEWSRIGIGINNGVSAIRTAANDDLIIGGGFQTAGSSRAYNVARYSQGEWSAISSGGTGTNPIGTVSAVHIRPSGEILVGGSFQLSNGAQGQNIARWTGTNWVAFAGGISSAIYTIQELSDGTIIIGASPQTFSRWNGTQWASMGLSGSSVLASTVMPNGDVIGCGSFLGGSMLGVNSPSVPSRNVVRWAPARAFGHITRPAALWPLANGLNDMARAATVLNGRLVVGGDFTQANGHAANRIAMWDGIDWIPLGSGMNNAVFALKGLYNGDLIAGGSFTTAGGISANRIARWNSYSGWAPLGGGVDGIVRTIEQMKSGDIAVGGDFTAAGGMVSGYFARYSLGGTPASISMQATDNTVCSTGSAVFSISAVGTLPIAYQWQYSRPASNLWSDAQPGILRDSAGTSIATVDNPYARQIMVRLSGGAGNLEDIGEWRCIIRNTCGPAVSNVATLRICRADINCDGVVDFFDYLDFVNGFSTGSAAADFNHDGAIDFFDYLDFVDTYSAGC